MGRWEAPKTDGNESDTCSESNWSLAGGSE